MTDASVIIPVCASDDHTLYVSLVGLRTCAASTDAPIVAMVNNTPEGKRRDVLRANCDLLGIRWHYVDGPFSMPRCLNLGTAITTGKYVAIGTADVIYYPRWLENIIDLWEENPHYFCLTNYSFDHDNNACCRQTTVPERRIVDTHNPSSGVLVLKRDNHYVWDEQFQFWEMDSDFLYFLERNGLKAGYCLNARCDHIINGIRCSIDYRTHFGIPKDANIDAAFSSEPRRLLERKWNLPALK